MRIFFIANGSKLYGANRSLLTLVEYFNKHHSVRVMLPSNGEMAEELNKLNISFIIVPYYSSFLYFKKEIKYLSIFIFIILNIIVFPIIFYQLYKFKPEIIHSNTSAENLGILFSKLLGIKHVSHIREFMRLDHGSYFLFGKRLKSSFINLSNGVIFVSKSVKKNIINKNFTTTNTVIYNGLNLFNKKIIYKKLSTSISFGIVGALDEGKGQYNAILYFNKILQKFPDSNLNIFGDKPGPYKRKLKRLIYKLNLNDKINFHGFVKNTRDIYNQLDFLLMFSRSEGFGRVTIEAMINGVVVVGYNNAGTSELITNKVTGFLFSNYSSFENSILTATKSSEKYNQIRENAFNFISDECNTKRYCSSVEKFMKIIIDNK